MEHSMEYSMLPNWSAGFYEVKSDGLTLYHGVCHGIFHGIFHRVNAPLGSATLSESLLTLLENVYCKQQQCGFLHFC
jgi:hypothetical protein